MDKTRIFLKRLKRFFSFLYTDVKRRTISDGKWKHFVWNVVEPVLVLAIIALALFLIALIILTITVLTSSVLHFSDDWTWNNVQGSWVVSMIVLVTGGTAIFFGSLI